MQWQFSNDAPIYTQLIQQVKVGIVTGAFPPGERLPSVRDLATEAGVNPNTMQRALAELERAKSRVRLLAIVDTLKYLHKGGRLPAAVSIAGELLKVKPIITLKDGRLGLVGKGVGVKGSLAALIKLVGEELAFDQRLPVYYGYTAHDELCQSLMALTRETFGPHPSQVHPVGAVIGTHVGPGAAVMVYLEQEK